MKFEILKPPNKSKFSSILDYKVPKEIYANSFINNIVKYYQNYINNDTDRIRLIITYCQRNNISLIDAKNLLEIDTIDKLSDFLFKHTDLQSLIRYNLFNNTSYKGHCSTNDETTFGLLDLLISKNLIKVIYNNKGE